MQFLGIVFDSSVNKILVFSVPVPPFGFGDDQVSIFTGIPDMVVPRKKSPRSLYIRVRTLD